MGLFSRTKIRPRYDTVQRVLTDDLLEIFRQTVDTEENREAFGAAQEVYDLAKADVDEFDRDGAYSRAVISSSRRNLVRSGAVSGGRRQTRGSLLEMGGAMNEAVSSSILAMDQARGNRMQTLLGAAGLLNQSSQALSISPLVNQAVAGAFQLESTRMSAQAQADAAQKSMVGTMIGGALTGGASVWSSFLEAGTEEASNG